MIITAAITAKRRNKNIRGGEEEERTKIQSRYKARQATLRIREEAKGIVSSPASDELFVVNHSHHLHSEQQRHQHQASTSTGSSHRAAQPTPPHQPPPQRRILSPGIRFEGKYCQIHAPWRVATVIIGGRCTPRATRRGPTRSHQTRSGANTAPPIPIPIPIPSLQKTFKSNRNGKHNKIKRGETKVFIAYRMPGSKARQRRKKKKKGGGAALRSKRGEHTSIARSTQRSSSAPVAQNSAHY